MNKVKKRLVLALAIPIGLFGLILTYAFLFYPAEYTLRVLRWGNSDVYDYQKFPERATGQPVADYLANKIWQPMGAAYDGSWSLDEQGFAKMESGINGRAIDFAKFGSLFLHQGEWNGKQIIPAAWVQESTEVDSEDSDTYYPEWFQETLPNGYYKYMWWGLQREGQADDFSAMGNHGQYIYISPSKQLVIVRHGEEYGTDMFDWPKLFFDFATEFDTLDQE